jgi:hypothetical protein
MIILPKRKPHKSQGTKVYAHITMLFLDVQEHWLLGPEILINESTFHFAKVVELSKTEPNNKP